MANDLEGNGWKILVGSSLDRLRDLPDDHFHCVVTSPPYWGLRDYGVDGQLGLEPTPRQFVENMVSVFEEVRRVLRPDGTLWLNIGDSFNAYNGGSGPGSSFSRNRHEAGPQLPSGYGLRDKSLKPKDLIGVPWMLAFALRDAGWYLRSEIVWHKRSPMPESVRDRPTKAHEQIFLFAKTDRYFYDQVAAAEKAVGAVAGNRGPGKYGPETNGTHRTKANMHKIGPRVTRNMRSVWSMSTEAFKGSHFATFPSELPRKCLMASTSEKGCCPICGVCWRRITEKKRVATRSGAASKVNRASASEDSPYNGHKGMVVGNRDPRRHTTEVKTVGWAPGCLCEAGDPVPCRVLDPFSGAGTTVMVARRLKCHAVGVELNPEYAAMAAKRIRDDQPLFN